MNSSVTRFGGTCAILASVVYVVLGVTYFLRPPTNSVESTMQALATSPIYLYIETLGFALSAVLLLAVITAMTDSLQHLNAGLIRWAGAIGYIACATSIVTNLRLVKLVPLRTSVFMQGDEMVRAAIQYNWVGNSLDPYGWLQFGATGVWMLVTAYSVARDGQLFPRAYGYLGLAVGTLYLLISVGETLAVPDLQIAGAALGGIVLGPAWAVWTGILLRRRADQLDALHRAA